jgi:hypothetical protein
MCNLCSLVFSPAASRAAFLACLSAASFTAGAMWARSGESPAPVALAELPVVPSADQAAAMTPRPPAFSDDFDDPPPTF